MPTETAQTFAIAKYPGLDLPVYDADAEVLSSKDEMMIAAAKAGKRHFVRTVSITGEGYDSLKQVLDTSDRELERIAELTHAEVIDHEWGLYRPGFKPLADQVPVVRPRNLLPAGMLLVAEVEVIQNARPLNYIQSRRRQRVIDQYYGNYERPVFTQGKHGDLFAGQYLRGYSFVKRARGIFLADIEPILGAR